MKDEPIPVNNDSPFAGGNFTPHPWIPSQDTLSPIADDSGPELIGPNDLINWKED